MNMKRTSTSPTNSLTLSCLAVFLALGSLGTLAWSQHEPLGRMQGVAGLGQPAAQDCNPALAALSAAGQGPCSLRLGEKR